LPSSSTDGVDGSGLGSATAGADRFRLAGREMKRPLGRGRWSPANRPPERQTRSVVARFGGEGLVRRAADHVGARRVQCPTWSASPLSYKAFAPNLATTDGLTLRRPVPGTIARGQRPFHFSPGEPEAIRAGVALPSPLPSTPSVLDDGKGAVRRSTARPCHGDSGKGDGPLAGKIPPPPAYRSERVLAFETRADVFTC